MKVHWRLIFTSLPGLLWTVIYMYFDGRLLQKLPQQQQAVSLKEQPGVIYGKNLIFLPQITM